MLDPNTTDLLWTNKTVCDRLDVSLTTLWRMRTRADFPRPIIINFRLYWRVAEVTSWAKHLAAATQAEEDELRARLPGYREAPNA
jgi:predicted DNA-binding transcriptional regulator AlpA